MVLMSAWTPAPPPLSEPAMARTRPRYCGAVMRSGLADRLRDRKRLTGLGDVVNPHRRRAGPRRRQGQGDRAAEALVGGGFVAGDPSDGTLATGANQHG